jgi:hypothetical protein
MMIRLPGDKGFVELLNEPEPSDRSRPEPTSIAAYYLQSDGKSPLTPAPTDVKFEIDAGRRNPRVKEAPTGTIPLSAEPKSGDPAGAGHFASKPGPYILDDLRGTLSAKIGGEEIAVSFAERR